MKIFFLGPHCQQLEDALIHAGHKVLQTEDKICYPQLLEEQCEFCISYRYKHIIKKEVIEYFQGRCINLHISYLPWCRGADPNLWSYLENTPSGVTIHMIDEGINTGNILLQQEVAIDLETATLKSSYDLLTRSIEQLFISNASRLLHNEIAPRKQEGIVSYHHSKDKIQFLHLIENKWWDTPIKELLPPRERVIVRHVNNNDKSFVFNLANDAEVRKSALQRHKISLEEHNQWFNNILRSGVPFYIISSLNQDCGYIRFSIHKTIAVLTLAIKKEFRNKGFAGRALNMILPDVLSIHEVECVQAVVVVENVASQRMFKKAHFVCNEYKTMYDREVVVYQYPGYFE